MPKRSGSLVRFGALSVALFLAGLSAKADSHGFWPPLTIPLSGSDLSQSFPLQGEIHVERCTMQVSTEFVYRDLPTQFEATVDLGSLDWTPLFLALARGADSDEPLRLRPGATPPDVTYTYFTRDPQIHAGFRQLSTGGGHCFVDRCTIQEDYETAPFLVSDFYYDFSRIPTFANFRALAESCAEFQDQ